MFEIIMFWFWVSVLVYSLLWLPMMIFAKIFMSWFKKRMVDLNLSQTKRSQIEHKIHKIVYMPLQHEFTKRLAPVIGPASIVIYIGVALYTFVSCVDSTCESLEFYNGDYVANLISFVSSIAGDLAFATSWAVPLVLIWLGANYLFKRVGNGILNAKEKIDRLDKALKEREGYK